MDRRDFLKLAGGTGAASTLGALPFAALAQNPDASGEASAAALGELGALFAELEETYLTAEWGIRSTVAYLAIRRLRWGYLTYGEEDPRASANLALLDAALEGGGSLFPG